MADIKRTTEGLEHCLARYVDGLCDDCPYMGEIDKSYMVPMKCKEIIMRDALELLKESKKIIDMYHKADSFLEAHGWKWKTIIADSTNPDKRDGEQK